MHHIVHWTPADESPELQADSIHIWKIDLEQPIGELEQLLSPDEIEKKQRLVSSPLRRRYVVARAGTRYILGGYLDMPGDRVLFDYGHKGKPTLRNPGANIQFNLSHSGEMALLVVSTSAIGVDLEQLMHRPSLLQLAQRVFSPTIQKELAGLSGDSLTQAFFHHWTAMESCAKCRGVGIFGPMEERCHCHTEHITPQPGWIGCVAAETPLPKADSWSSYRLNLSALIE